MNLLDLAVKITCDDQASGQVEGIGSRITGTIGKVGSVVSAVLGSAAVAGAVAIGKSALDAYASYEQLVGGMDTLFKGASATVQQYAANAYQTAGVSANRYMQITTSFAASLISSLGGDTAAAAEMANMAITDMSDNANKMGTSLDVVQEAYMSLARGNYEMLDSLALGYAGTKSGLEQLLADAEQYAAAQGEVRDFSVDSYADIVEAIHIVQTEMGITGTTAQEAASTIEGSVNQMKAAWENWLAGLGNEQADMSALTDQLVNSVITAGQNVIPRVVEIMGTLADTVAQQAPQVGQRLYEALMATLPESVSGPLREAFSGASEIVTQVTDALAPGIQSMADTVGVVAQGLAEAFSPTIQEAMELIAPAAEQLGQFMEHMGTQIQEVLVPALQPLGDAFTGLFEAIEPWIEPLGNVANIFGNILVGALTAAATALTFIIEVVTTVMNAIVDFDNFLNGQPSMIGDVINAIIQWFSELPGNIANFLSNVIGNVANWVSSMVAKAAEVGSNFLSNVVSFFSQLPGNVWSFLSSVISNVGHWVLDMAQNARNAGMQFLQNVVSFITQLPGQVASFLGSVISNVAGFVGNFAGKALQAGQQFLSNIVNELGKIPGRVFSIGSDIVSGVWNGIQSAAGWFGEQVSNFFGGIVDGAKAALGIASPSKVMRREVGRWIPAGIAEGIDDYAEEPVRSMDSVMRGIESSAVDYSPQVRAGGLEGASVGDLLSAVESLHSDLAAIIRDNTPVMTRREFRRAVMSV